ncbi:hypothetical protein PACTADRAFT_31355 [Pachysolen tannophilus NRRL Y-2460]|uniref:Uncharacterized protein n=1 Tax=Pachysolen tannophilus NRRL Y-2460 TaxID=669874 RepID=A0A1E4U1R2_PACTA|nr:hypothetical protein PACTADRAFT_31355 [Pachysolen tannophilus NRRL Y-2460]
MYTFYDDANNISDTEKTDSPSQVMSSMNTSISSRKHISSANSSKLQLDKLMKAIDAEKYLAEDDRELINMDLNNEPPLQEDISYIRPSSPVIVNVANKENNDPMEQINGENYHMFNGVSNGITDSLGNSGQNDKNTLLPSNLLSIEYDTLQEKHQHHHGVDSTNGTTILSGSYTSLYVSNKHDHNGTSTMWSRLPTRDHSFYAQECGSPLKNTGFIRENLASYYPLSSSSSLPTSRDVTRLPQSAAGPQNTDVTQRSMSVKKSKNITTFQKKSGGVSTRLRQRIFQKKEMFSCSYIVCAIFRTSAHFMHFFLNFCSFALRHLKCCIANKGILA